jgi:uncharacterized membrane protein
VVPKTPGGVLVGDTALRSVIIVIGILLLLGALMLQSRVIINRNDFPSYDEYRDALRSAAFAGLVLIDVAMFLLFLFALLVGVQRTDLSDSTRTAFMAFALVVFLLWWWTVISQSQYYP